MEVISSERASLVRAGPEMPIEKNS